MVSRSVTFVVLGLAMFTSGTALTWSGSTPSQAADQKKDPQLKALLQERHAILQNLADVVNAEFRNARASQSQVMEASRVARQAELDLCETDQERVAVLEKMLAEARAYEQSADEERKSARGTYSSALKATADRLDVEIALERAKTR